MAVHKLFPFILLLVGVSCAPRTWGAGGKFGYSNVIDAQIGGQGQIDRDGMSLDYNGKSRTGAIWKPKLYGGVYVQIDDNMYVADGALGAFILNYLNTRGHYAGGVNSKGSVPIAFEPGMTVENGAYIDPQAHVYTGQEAWQRAMMYGAEPPQAQIN